MKPDIEPTLTIEPLPALSMCVPKERQHQKMPLRLTSSTFSQCSSSISSARRLRARDAGVVDQDVDGVPRQLVGERLDALRSRSRRPSRRRRRSPWPSSRRGRPRRSSRCSRRSRPWRRPRASASTQARPIACPPPVTTATRPFKSILLEIHAACSTQFKSGCAIACAVGIEAMDAVRPRRQRNLVAGRQRSSPGARAVIRPTPSASI